MAKTAKPTPRAIEQASKLLGVPEREIANVEDSPAGTIITQTDGSRLIDVTVPDAEGKTGLMFLVAPTDPYRGSFPVYAWPAEDDGEETTATG